MNIASYGGGTNSTAMIIECFNRGIDIDLILFADTGGEKPHTYNYVNLFNEWLGEMGATPIITVKKVDKNGEIETLEENSIKNKMLPSIAYGYKKCSHKFKIAPQDKYVNNWPPAKEWWKQGKQITKLIGFDADEPNRANFKPDEATAKKYSFRYPLIEWDMGRDECIETIKKAGLCLPGKSACYFCPNSKVSEIKQLAAVYPDLAERAVAMEQNANLTHIKGLGRNYAWKDIIASSDMFEDDYFYTPEMSCDCYDG